MPTPKQIEANRLNSLKSCGPKSPQTKAKVSQNRRTHGLCGKFSVLACESQERFDSLVAALIEAEQPADASEVELVVKMAEHSWRARRALRLQDACFEMEEVTQRDLQTGQRGITVNALNLETAMRYHTLHDRAYRRAAQELMERKKQRHLAEIGFERKKQAAAEAQRKSEKHELAQDIAKLKKQLLEIRFAKASVALLTKNVIPKASEPQNFEMTEVGLAGAATPDSRNGIAGSDRAVAGR